jgi:acyl-CoA hydrolase
VQADEVTFQRPVDIGDLVRLKARVVHTADNPVRPHVLVEVHCHVVKPEK